MSSIFRLHTQNHKSTGRQPIPGQELRLHLLRLRAVCSRRAQTCEIELVQEDPMAGLQGSQQGTISPGEACGAPAFFRHVGSQQVHHVRLLAQVYPHQLMPCRCPTPHRFHRLSTEFLRCLNSSAISTHASRP